MNRLKDLSRGPASVLAGAKMLTRPGVRRYVVMPLLINVLLFAGAIWAAVAYLDAWLASLLPEWLAWAEWLLLPLFGLMLLLVTFFTFTLVANFIAAPFNALLAARLEQQLSGVRPQGADQPLGQLVLSTMGAELRKLGYLLKWLLPLLLITVIPVVNLAAPLLWFVFGAWFLALEYADYPMGNHDIPYLEQRRRLRQRRGLALSLGGTLSLMTMVPVLNFFAMPVGVAAATRLWVQQLSVSQD